MGGVSTEHLKDHQEHSLKEELDSLATVFFPHNYISFLLYDHNPDIRRKEIESRLEQAALHERASRCNCFDLKDAAAQFVLQKKGQFEPEQLVVDGDQLQLTPQDFRKYIEVCECCNNMAGEELPLCLPLRDLSFLGPGLLGSLYFMTLTLFSLLPTYFLLAVYSSVVNVLSSDGRTVLGECGESAYCRAQYQVSLYFQLDKYGVVERWLGVGASVLFFVLFETLRLVNKQISNSVDSEVTTPADYSVMLTGLPEGYSEQYIREQLQLSTTWLVGRKCEIAAFEPVLDLSTYFKHRKRVQEIVAEYKELNDAYLLRQFLLRVSDQFYELKGSLVETKRLARAGLLEERRTRVALVHLSHKSEKDNIMAVMARSNKSLAGQLWERVKDRLRWTGCFKVKGLEVGDEVVRVEEPGEPEDVLFDNCRFQFSLGRYVGFWVATLLIIAASLAISLGFEYLKSYCEGQQAAARSEEDKLRWTNLGTAARYGAQVITIVINKLIMEAIPKFASLERHFSRSRELISLTNKTLVSLVLNTTFVPLVVSTLIQGLSPFDSKSVVTSAFEFALTNSLLVNLLLVLDIGYFLGRLVHSLDCWLEGALKDLTPKQFNQAFEGPQLDISQHYVYCINFLVFGAFYMPIQPTAMLFAVLGVFLRYCAVKYLLLRRHCRPPMVHQSYNDAMGENLEFVTLFYGLGLLVFTLLREPYSQKAIPSIIILGVSVLLVLFYRYSMLEKCVIRQRLIAVSDEVEDQHFDQVQFPNNKRYSELNPLQRVLADQLFPDE